MSQVSIRAALETALNALAPAIATAWENVTFAPPASSTPYQAAFILFAEPENPEAGAVRFERGIFQVNLLYPLKAGDSTARARAEMVRTAFYRGRSMSSGGVTVVVEKTPEAGQGTVSGDRWLIPVKIRFFAQLP